MLHITVGNSSFSLTCDALAALTIFARIHRWQSFEWSNAVISNWKPESLSSQPLSFVWPPACTEAWTLHVSSTSTLHIAFDLRRIANASMADAAISYPQIGSLSQYMGRGHRRQSHTALIIFRIDKNVSEIDLYISLGRDADPFACRKQNCDIGSPFRWSSEWYHRRPVLRTIQVQCVFASAMIYDAFICMSGGSGTRSMRCEMAGGHILHFSPHSSPIKMK